MIAFPQAPPADSVQAALRHVFSAREYDWTERRGVFSWLQEQYLRLLDWLARLEETHPQAYYLLLAAMIAVTSGSQPVNSASAANSSYSCRVMASARRASS